MVEWDEEALRAEFEKLGEAEVSERARDALTSQLWREAAYRWLGEKNASRTKADAEHRENERLMARWTRRLGWFTAVLAVTSILTLWVLYRTDETSRLRDRAFVYFGDPQRRPYPDANPIVWAFSIKFGNAGNMPASRVAVRVACPDAPFTDDVSDSFRLATDWTTAQIASVIGPKQDAEVQGCEVKIEKINEAKNHNLRVFYLVEAKYLDGFDLHTTRVTQMSRALAFDQWGGYSMGFTNSHNCTDDDCPK